MALVVPPAPPPPMMARMTSSAIRSAGGIACVQCRKRRVDVVNEPCGHGFFCEDCSITARKQQGNKCPSCHEPSTLRPIAEDDADALARIREEMEECDGTEHAAGGVVLFYVLVCISCDARSPAIGCSVLGRLQR